VPPPFCRLGPTWDFCGTQSYLRLWTTVNNKSFRLQLSGKATYQDLAAFPTYR
jgi:hypothetical protein